MQMTLRLINSAACELERLTISIPGKHASAIACEYVDKLADAAWVLVDGDRIEVTFK